MYVDYFERLTGATVSIELPSTRDDAFDLLATIERAGKENAVEWKTLVRAYTASDLYMLGLMSSAGDRIDPYTNRVEIDNQFLFEYSREVQFDSDGWVDITARAHWKSTWDTFLDTIRVILVDPNISIGIFSHELPASQKHLTRVKNELTDNVLLKTAWDDILYIDPVEDARLWSVNGGIIVKGRTLNQLSPTVGAYTFLVKLPTGARLAMMKFDDVETEKTTEEDEQREKVYNRFKSALSLAGRGVRVRVKGTHHHSMGQMARLRDEGWPVRCHKAEDISKPAPDIAALYDKFLGKDPATGQDIPSAVRDIGLSGEPILLHPLECAIKRHLLGDSVYCMQYMGDSLAGVQSKFSEDDIIWYDEDPIERADGKNLYILIDASRGMTDPTFMIAAVLGMNRKISWVGAINKKIDPGDLGEEVFNFTTRWQFCCARLIQIRVEIYGQATYDVIIKNYFEKMKYFGAPIVGAGSHDVRKNRVREWNLLHPQFRNKTIEFPKVGIFCNDEKNRKFDAVRRFIEEEFRHFPQPLKDNGLAAWALLFHPEDKRLGIQPLEFPEDEETRDRHDNPYYNQKQRGESWMSEGF